MPTALTPDQLKQFRRDGYAVLRGVYSAEEVAEMRDTFTAVAEAGPVPGMSEVRHGGSAYDPADPLAKYPRMVHPHKHPESPVGPLAMRHLLDARLRGVLRDLFDGEEPIAAQSMFYFKPPGSRGQELHQDNLYLRVKPGTCMAAWIAVDDADAENGGMVVVPESDKLDILCPGRADPTKSFTGDFVAPPPGYVPTGVDLKAGDVLFFNGSIIHGSSPNTSADRFRRSLIFHYVPAGCAEVSDFYRPLLRFDGSEVERAVATGGGPCGTSDVGAMH